MTEQRDDRTRVRETDKAVRLEVWAAALGRSFTWDGPSQAAVRLIVRDTLERFETFKDSVPDPEGFLARRIAAAANAYRTDRGVAPIRVPVSVVPHLTDVVRARGALEMLPSGARRALQILFDNEDASYRHVAEELDVTVGYAKYLVDKAITVLEQWLVRTWPRG